MSRRGIMQLVANDSQDVYLTGTPIIKQEFKKSLSAIKKLRVECNETFNPRCIESLTNLPNELLFDILQLCSDYQLRKLELYFKELIQSKYFIRQRVKEKLRLAISYRSHHTVHSLPNGSTMEILPNGDIRTALYFRATIPAFPEPNPEATRWPWVRHLANSIIEEVSNRLIEEVSNDSDIFSDSGYGAAA